MLCHVSIVHSFLLQTSIPLHEFTTVSLFIFLFGDFGVLSVWVIVNKAALNICQSFCRYLDK